MESSETGPDGTISIAEVAAWKAAKYDAIVFRFTVMNNKRIRDGLDPLTMEEFCKPKEKPMQRGDVFKSNYLAQADCRDDVLVLTIASVGLETVGQGKDAEERAVMHFAGNAKPMVINAGNWSICEELFGSESDHWQGKNIEVYVDPNVSFGGKRTGGLRLRRPSGDKFAPPKTNGTAWTLAQCRTECEKAGIPYADMVAALKARGNGAFFAQRDTPFVKQMIADKSSGAKEAEESFDDDQVPF